MSKRVLFYSSVTSKKLFDTQKFYRIDIDILRDLGYTVILSNKVFDVLSFWKYDFVFAYFYRKAFLVALFARLYGKDTYFTGGIDDLDESYASSKRYLIQKILFNLCYLISKSCIIVSHSDLKNIKKCLCYKTLKKTSFSEHAINTDVFSNSLSKKDYFLSIGWMGSIENVQRKGIDTAIKLFARIREIPKFEHYKFFIIGKEGDGTSYLQSLIKKLNLNDSVKLIGECPENEKIMYLKQSRYYFQLSKYEGFGLAALEALCANCILIHSGKGGLSNPVYSNQLLFDIDNVFDNELSVLIEKISSFSPPILNNDILLYYDIQRRKEDLKAIISDECK
ncbi:MULTISPECIES: glycosyltransferase family 4 protein [Bacteroides]|jgi:glycosyltransferase involved in cell wall biosynthesis|uniref:Glycosyltransferase n=1 Tax=Bacteroides intestinalis TaxID=329854 RepID=A0AAQ0RUR0_9BACE|nr:MULTISPECIES: glycosyltransferase family 4 protein [Bacteroides]RGT58258.1 glycosyltransferase [Bacteroides intestinalis]